jgi:hypothetical protein
MGVVDNQQQLDIALIETTIKALFADITPPGQRLGEVEYQWLFDRESHHYQLLLSGWEGIKRTFGIVIQVDVKDNLVWIQEDNTDLSVANRLVEAGIPKSQIVLAFHAPYKRKYTGFATGE